MQESTVHVNIVPGGMPIVLHISQYDVGLRQYVFTLYSTQGTWSDVSGASATLEATKPDNHAIVHNCTYNNDGTITYTVQEQLAAVVGRVWSKLVIRDTSDNVVASAAIIWIVDQAGVTDSAIVSDSDISALQEFLAEFGTINAYKADLDSLRALATGVNVAATKAAMTNHSIAYVYTGSESGMVTNNWYWYNGSDWVSGGAWQASIETDTTLTTSGKAADAKATGDQITELKSEMPRQINDVYKSIGVTNIWDNYLTGRTGSVSTVSIVDGKYVFSSAGAGRVTIYDNSTSASNIVLQAGKTYTILFDCSSASVALQLYYRTSVNTTNNVLINGTSNVYEITIPANAVSYIFRIDVPSGVTGQNNAIIRIYEGIYGKELFKESSISIPSWEDGKYASKTGNIGTDNTYSTVNYISVFPSYKVQLYNISVTGNVAVLGYDHDQNYISTLVSESDVQSPGTLINVEVNIPKNVYYIRFSVKTASKGLTTLQYKDYPLSQVKNIIDIIDGRNVVIPTINSRFSVNIKNLGVTIGKTPIATIIDDDTSTLESIGTLKGICDEYGIKITFSGIGNNIETVSGMKERLLQYQDEGFHIASHSYSHASYWKIDDESYDIEEAEADLIKSIVYMRENGFVNYDMLVSPFNTYFTTEFRNMVSKYVQCAVNAGGRDPHMNTLTNMTRYELQRTRFIGSTSASTLSYFSDLIDQAIEDGAWIIMGTHSNSNSEWNESLVRSVIEYAQGQNLEFVTLNEGFRRRKPAYDFYDLVK